MNAMKNSASNRSNSRSSVAAEYSWGRVTRYAYSAALSVIRGIPRSRDG